MTDLDTRVNATERRFKVACNSAGELVTGDDRVSEKAAAQLLGVHRDTLRGWRSQGEAPVSYRMGGQVTYRLRDLAVFVELGRTTWASSGDRG